MPSLVAYRILAGKADGIRAKIELYTSAFANTLLMLHKSGKGE